MASTAPVECDVPLASALQPRWVATAYFSDAYRAPLKSPPAHVVDIFFSLNQNKLIAGRDNTHLDFRLSLLRELDGSSPLVVVSTVCVVRNLSGKVHLFFIVPFHKWSVKYLISRAPRAGRL